MSKITIEQIDSVRNRANVGYKEAKEALEKFDGDIIETILFLENEKKIKSDIKITNTPIFGKAKDLLHKLNNVNVKLQKGEKSLINLPSTVVIIGCIIGLPFVLIGTAIAIFNGYKIKIENHNNNQVYTKMSDVVEVDLSKK